MQPNPFKDRASFIVPSNSGNLINLTIYDLTGRRIKSFEGVLLRATNHTTWSGEDDRGIKVRSGVYLYKAITERGTVKGKVVLSP